MAEDPLENDQEWDSLRLRDDEELDFFTELALHEAERWIQVICQTFPRFSCVSVSLTMT